MDHKEAQQFLDHAAEVLTWELCQDDLEVLIPLLADETNRSYFYQRCKELTKQHGKVKEANDKKYGSGK